ncbi:MAG: sulfite exporter TauE/SafE family protein [Deltaproteobacteria bacterium]|nr:sulfite exporter TauE/SafE family protein [Deltaproteobacteria bacterium]
MDVDTTALLIAITSLFAATVNGALGYGYSSITVPISLLVTTSRVLNPALVIVEVVVNLYALFLGRRSIRRVWPQVRPIAFGILPGVAVGSLVLASISVEWAKLVTYGTLLPLILIQAAGLRFPIQRIRMIGLPFGAGVGLLYSMTTISGPPLALYFNNQGMAKDDFKVALAITRSIESLSTLLAYAALGMITAESTALVPYLAPGVLIGLPIGFALIRHIDAETFRRVCMSFDAWLVGFGLSRVVAKLELLPEVWAFQLLTLTVIVDAILLRTFFRSRAAKKSPVHDGGIVATSLGVPGG